MVNPGLLQAGAGWTVQGGETDLQESGLESWPGKINVFIGLKVKKMYHTVPEVTGKVTVSPVSESSKTSAASQSTEVHTGTKWG